MKFSEAFAAARKAGKKEFTWEGKRYNTKLRKSSAPKSSPRPPEKYAVQAYSKRSDPEKDATGSSAPMPNANSGAIATEDNQRQAAKAAARNGPSTRAKRDPADMTFKQAFAAARRADKKTFTWNGKKYTTEVKRG